MKKLSLLLMSIVLIMCLSACGSSTEETGNALLDAELQTDDVLSGSGDNIGTYAYINISKEDLESVTEEQFLNFANNVVDGSSCDYISIICDDGTGIEFPGSNTEYANYGNIDDTGVVTETLNTIIINDNAITYENGDTITGE